MALEVIGAGFGRTGTMSLKVALERLGFAPCYHMMEVAHNPAHLDHWEAVLRGEALDWERLFADYRAAVDWPVCSYWRLLRERYPEARVILTERDPEAWHRSVLETIYPSSVAGLDSDDPVRRRHCRWIDALIWQGTFDGRVEEAAHAIAVFEAHNAAVKAALPSDRLLVYRPGDGWGPLCAFLDRPVPQEPFPRLNSSDEYEQRWREIRGPAS